jgi:hypothetical protein
MAGNILLASFSNTQHCHFPGQTDTTYRDYTVCTCVHVAVTSSAIILKLKCVFLLYYSYSRCAESTFNQKRGHNCSTTIVRNVTHFWIQLILGNVSDLKSTHLPEAGSFPVTTYSCNVNINTGDHLKQQSYQKLLYVVSYLNTFCLLMQNYWYTAIL